MRSADAYDCVPKELGLKNGKHILGPSSYSALVCRLVIWGLCALALATVRPAFAGDCNRNNSDDATDIARGASQDCNGDGIPDECANCPGVEVIFIVDTSQTAQSHAICSLINDVLSNLQSAGANVQSRILRILGTANPAFPCVNGAVCELLDHPPIVGPWVCPPIGNQKDWGMATAGIAANYRWADNSVRVIVPVFLEAPRNGDPCNDPGDDREIISQAIGAATENHVIVSPIALDGAQSCARELAISLSSATGGVTADFQTALSVLPASIASTISQRCIPHHDCNENGVPDECEADTDGDGVIDTCDACPNDPAKTAAGVCGCGVPDVDTDGDGILDCRDNCPAVANADQADSDNDGVGDACEDAPAPSPYPPPVNLLDPELQRKLREGALGNLNPACGVGAGMVTTLTLAGLLSVRATRRRRR